MNIVKNFKVWRQSSRHKRQSEILDDIKKRIRIRECGGEMYIVCDDVAVEHVLSSDSVEKALERLRATRTAAERCRKSDWGMSETRGDATDVESGCRPACIQSSTVTA